jgi:hypothetical protein
MLLDEASLRHDKFQSGSNTFEEWKKWEAGWEEISGTEESCAAGIEKGTKTVE